MAISNVKAAIGLDLATLLVSNGYSTDIKTIYKVPKFPMQVDATKCPAISYFWTNAPRKPFTEAEDSYDLMYTIIIHVSGNTDVDESGDLDDELGKIYDDIVELFNKQTCNVYKLDEVERLEVGNCFPDAKDTFGWAFIPLKIIYKR